MTKVVGVNPIFETEGVNPNRIFFIGGVFII